MENNFLESIIMKDETQVTCDNDNCDYHGEMFYCYMDNHKRCSLYLDYIAQNT